MRLRYWLLLAALPACTDDYNYEPDPGFGELGVGVFLYECPTSGDSFCDNGNPAPVFPQAFALGGRIHLQYDWKDDSDHFSDPLPQLQSASPTLLASASDGFTALATGSSAVLAVTGTSEVVDLRHLHIREIASLQISDHSETLALTEFQLEPGSDTLMQARAVDADDVTLGGVLGYAWSTGDADVLIITAGADSGQARVQAVNPGETTLTLALGERSVVVNVTVSAAQTTATDTGSSSADTGSSDDTGSSGDTGSSDDTGSSSSDTGSSSDSSSSTGGAL
jgi:hypothetical protein